MQRSWLLSLGMVAGGTFIVGTLVLGLLLDNYSSSRQTVSEIGAIGSPMELPYALMLSVVSLTSILFAVKARSQVILEGLGGKGLILIGFFGLLDAGFAIFPSPHQLHNIFGLLHTLPYFAPLVLFFEFRRSDNYQGLANLSLLAMLLVLIGIFLNLSPMFAPTLYPLEYYGYVQRLLLYSYYTWLIIVSFSIWRKSNLIVDDIDYDMGYSRS